MWSTLTGGPGRRQVFGRSSSLQPRSHVTRGLRIATALTLCLAATPFITSGGTASAVTIGGFEIDGNRIPQGALDWNSPEVQPQPRATDPVRSNQDDSFVGGNEAKEEDPANWDLQNAAVSPVANDIGD